VSGKTKQSGSVPEMSRGQIAREKWISRAYAFAALCLGALAVLEVTDKATPFLQTVLMAGIVLAGTAAWVMQAKRKCPKCGEVYGYHFRIVNANICRMCGAEFPKWRPGMTEEGGKSDGGA
jgi:hypothetical protein